MTSTAVASYQPLPVEAQTTRWPAVTGELSSVFANDAAGPDRLARSGTAELLAEVMLHRGVETPLTIAVFGPVGSGRSQFLGQVAEAATGLSKAAAGETPPGPFETRIMTVRIDAESGTDPVAVLIGPILDALGRDFPALAEEAVYAGSDPREATRLAGERLNEARRSLEEERRTLDALNARRSRLVETVLSGDAGTRFDAYTRTHRGRIDARLRGFGFSGPDVVPMYKALVGSLADGSGTRSRLGLALKSLWAYRGQALLMTAAILFLVLGWAASAGAVDQGAVAAWLSSFGDRFTAVTDWLRQHLALLRPIGQIAYGAAVLAALLDLLRAARFLGPVFRGASLLRGDLDDRRREVDGLLAHQTRRVDQLSTDVEAAGRTADAAERRGAERRGTGLSHHAASLAGDLFGLKRGHHAAAVSLLDHVSAAMSTAPDRTDQASAPGRILVAIDGLDHLNGPAASSLIETAHRLLARRGFAVIVAIDRRHLAAALGEADPALAAARLDRMVQLSYDLGAATADPAALADMLLDTRVAGPDPAPRRDAAQSVLDRSLQPFETELVRSLAAFAGNTPRAVKRFVNSYRVARADPRMTRATPAALGTMGWALALDGTSAGAELAAFEAEVANGKVTMNQASDLGRSFAAALAAIGQDISVQEARRGLSVARSYSRRG